MRKKILLNNRIYKNEKEFKSMHKYLSNINENKDLTKHLKIENTLINLIGLP